MTTVIKSKSIKKSREAKVEILAPVGSFESLQAALKAGANSVYFGIGKLNMRSKSSINFTLVDLKKIVSICKKTGIKTYLTLNTVMYDEDLREARKVCDAAKKTGINAVIVSDMSVMEYARKIKLRVHLSTQANISNIEAVKFFSKYADTIILARELTLKQISDIVKKIKKEKIKGPSGELVKIEVFVHGALCVSISGKCYMSLHQYGNKFSANRGACLQPCRREYKVIDEETGQELKVDNKYIMSPKDLCTISMIDKLIRAGVSIFKIEGRGRSADYVYATVKCYKEAVGAVYNGNYSKEKIAEWTKELESVFNRGFWQDGYYLGNKLGEWSGVYGSRATQEKIFIGKVGHYFSKASVGEFLIQSGETKLKVGDEFIITGNTTGIVKGKVEKMVSHGKSGKEKPVEITSASKGDTVTFPVKEIIRKNDKLLVVRERKDF